MSNSAAHWLRSHQQALPVLVKMYRQHIEGSLLLHIRKKINVASKQFLRAVNFCSITVCVSRFDQNMQPRLAVLAFRCSGGFQS
jgi:hypothetical protein